MNTTTHLMYARSKLYGFPITMDALREALATNPCEAVTQQRRMKIVVQRIRQALQDTHPVGIPPGIADDLWALHNACAAYNINDPDGSIARVLGVCALLDIEVRTGP